MNKVYFAEKGEQGLSSTHANHLANIAKEMQEEAINRINNVKFYETHVSIIGQEGTQLMSTANTCDFLAELEKVSALNSFCAWIREALKEKEAQMEDIKHLSLEDYCEANNITIPSQPHSPQPVDELTEKDVISTWDINKRCKYLKLEAFASTFGKYIHPNGTFANARKDAHKVMNTPLDYQGEGRDTIFFHRKLIISSDDIERTFMNLQSHYRSYEKELNYMKSDLKSSVLKLNTELHEKYNSEYETWTVAYGEYRENMNYLQQQLSDFKLQELDRVANLRIAIPNELKEIFELVKSYDSAK